MNNNQFTDGSNAHTTTFATNCPSSPAQGRSLREFEEQMAALRKENFNLKLRIYFLEEKPSGSMNKSCTSMETNENISKQNIDLKVFNGCHGSFLSML